MKKSFKTKSLSIFLSILMLFCMIPQIVLADDVPTVTPGNYEELENALKSTTPQIIEINKSLTLNNELELGANHTLSISSGSAIYLAGNCKLTIPSEIELTVNGGGKLACHETSSNTILVNGTLILDNIDFEIKSTSNQIYGKLTATDCNVKIANSSNFGIVLFGELEITGGTLDVSNTGVLGHGTYGIFSGSESPILISDCEVKLNSNGYYAVTAIGGSLYVKNSEVYSEINSNGDHNSQSIEYKKLTFDNSTVTLSDKEGAVGLSSRSSDSELKIINGSTVRIQHQGAGTGIFISPMSLPNTASLIIDDSVLELYPGGTNELDLGNGAQINGYDYGKIIFHENSELRAGANKIKDRGIVFTSESYITVGAPAAPAAPDAISAGEYTWDGTYFSNTTVAPTDITFTAVQTGGVSGTSDSTGINITFSEDVAEFTEDKISITDGTGAVVKGALSGSGKNYTIFLASVTAEGTVTLSIENFGSYRVTTGAQSVEIYKNTSVPLPTDITFTAVQTGGVSGTSDSTGINITFSENVTGFTEDKVSITDGTGLAVKGSLSGSGKDYTISLASVTAEGTVNLSIADFGCYRVTTAFQTVNVYKNTAGGNNSGNPDDSGSSPISTKINSNAVNGNTINPEVKELDGVLTSNVDSNNINNAIKNADESKGNPVINIVINQKYDIDTIKIAVANDGWKQIAQKENMSLKIKAGSIILTFDNAAINEIYKQAKKDIIIQLGAANKADLTMSQQESIGKNQAYDLSVSSDSKVISELGGKVNIRLPYTLKSGENAESVVIYHVDEDGGLKIVKNAAYNASVKTVDFNTNHFSIYMIGYNHTSFSDVASGFWGKSAIDFSSARNLVEGTGNNKFEPNRAITRAEFTQMIFNVFELDTIDNKEFEDVKPGAWYYSAVMACKKTGFFEKLDLSDNEFKPNQVITREEMAVMLSNIAKYCKASASSNVSVDLTKFSDYDNINKDFAVDIILAINLGLLDKNGIGNSKFDPKGSTTRAQAAQIQKNMMYILDIIK